MKVEDKAVYDNRKIKNKRTVAAVSAEDKVAALDAMEELRSKGKNSMNVATFYKAYIIYTPPPKKK